MVKFLLRSHFLSICSILTVEQHINHGAIQKVYHLHNGIFLAISLCHTFSSSLYHPHCVTFTKNNKFWNERKKHFLYIWLLQRITSYPRRTVWLLDVFFLLAVILSELHENPRRKRLIYRKKYIEEFVWGTSLFWLYALLLMSFFVAFFVYSLSFIYPDFM